MIVEPVVRVILHCSRCNTPWLDPESESPALWVGCEEIKKTFDRIATGDLDGWRRTLNRYLCKDCHIVESGQVAEKPPPRAIEMAAALRAHAEYDRLIGRVAAYELLPTTPEEVTR